MENEKRLIDANALWLVFGEEAEKIEMGAKDHKKLVTSKLLIHWCMEQLAKAPKVDVVEVVHGRWIPRMYENSYILYHCSECCAPNTRERNYCPDCGADMRGSEE